MKFKKYIKNALFALAAGALFTTCTSVIDPDPSKIGDRHFPLDVGTFIIYDIDSIAYSEILDQPDTVNYQLKEYIESSFIDQSGNTAYRIERYFRTDENSPWPGAPKDVWTARKNEVHAVKTEENIPFVKLSFPFSDGKEWDGNIYNNLEDLFGKINDTYTMTNVFFPYQANNQTFENTVTVIQENASDPIVKNNFRKEVYAKDIGLIYIERQVFKYSQEPQDLGKQVIKSGEKYWQIINSYGKE